MPITRSALAIELQNLALSFDAEDGTPRNSGSASSIIENSLKKSKSFHLAELNRAVYDLSQADNDHSVKAKI